MLERPLMKKTDAGRQSKDLLEISIHLTDRTAEDPSR